MTKNSPPPNMIFLLKMKHTPQIKYIYFKLFIYKLLKSLCMENYDKVIVLYFRLRLGLANSLNTYLWLKIM